MLNRLRLLAALICVSLLPLGAQFGDLPLGDTVMSLTPEAPSDERQFVLKQDVDGMVFLVVGSEEINIAITTPDGVVWTPEAIVAGGGSFEQGYQEEGAGLSLMPPGHTYAIELPSAEQGLYLFRATAKTTPTEPVGVMVMPFPSGGDLDALDVARGPSVTFTGVSQSPVFAGVPALFAFEALDNAQPIPGVQVSHRFVMGADVQTIVLRDDGQQGDVKAGDGIHSASFTPPAAGPLHVYLEASIPAWEGPLLQDWPLNVEPAPARLIGEPQVTPLDEDGDGRFETLAVNAEVEVVTAGKYGWSAWIDYPGEWGSQLGAGEEQELSPGRHRLSARFVIFGELPDNTAVVLHGDSSRRQAITKPFAGTVRADLTMHDFIKDPAGVESVLARLSAEDRANLEPYLTERSSVIPKVIQQAVIVVPQLSQQSLAEPPVRLTGLVSIAPVDRDKDGRPEDVVLTAPVRLARGVAMTSALMTAQHGRSRTDGPLTAQSDYPVAEGIDRIEIIVPGSRLIAAQFEGPGSVDLWLQTTAGEVRYKDVAAMPAISYNQLASVEAKVLSITPTEVEPGQTVRLRVQTQGIDTEPSGWGPRIELDGPFFVPEVASSDAPNSFYVDFEVPAHAYPGKIDVEIAARGFRQKFEGALTILGFPVRLTGEGRAFAHDSDDDGVNDQVAWEFQVTSRQPVEVDAALRLAAPTEIQRSNPGLYLRQITIPAGNSVLRFYAKPAGLWDRGNNPSIIVGDVVLRKARGSRNEEEAAPNQYNVRLEASQDDFPPEATAAPAPRYPRNQ